MYFQVRNVHFSLLLSWLSMYKPQKKGQKKEWKHKNKQTKRLIVKFVLLHKRPRTTKIFHINPIFFLHILIIVPTAVHRANHQHQLIFQVPLQQPHFIPTLPGSAPPISAASSRLPPLPANQEAYFHGADKGTRCAEQREKKRAAKDQKKVSPPAAIEPRCQHPGDGGERDTVGAYGVVFFLCCEKQALIGVVGMFLECSWEERAPPMPVPHQGFLSFLIFLIFFFLVFVLLLAEKQTCDGEGIWCWKMRKSESEASEMQFTNLNLCGRFWDWLFSFNLYKCVWFGLRSFLIIGLNSTVDEYT